MNTEETSEKLVNNIVKGNNVSAQKNLEKILQDKVAKRIKETLDNE